MPLPIPGSMLTDLPLREYIAIGELQPRGGYGPPTQHSLTYEDAGVSVIIGVDDITASMMVAYYVRTGHDDGTNYNLGRSKPYQFPIFVSNKPATRRAYKQHSANPVPLNQSEWPHVYPSSIGVIPMHVYKSYELMPTQRTAALNPMEPPAWADSNPNDSDSPIIAQVRHHIINTYIHYPYNEALCLVDKVRTHNPADKNLEAAEHALALIAAGQQAAAFSYVVPGPLDGPLAGSGRPSKSRDPLGPIVAGTRSSRNKSAEYLEDPDIVSVKSRTASPRTIT